MITITIPLETMSDALAVLSRLPPTVRDLRIQREPQASDAAIALARLAESRPAQCSAFVTSRVWRGEAGEVTCSVCHDPIEAREEFCLLACGHHYHHQCARRLTRCAECRA